MANDLQYTAAQVAPYLVAATSRLRYIGVDRVELALVKSEKSLWRRSPSSKRSRISLMNAALGYLGRKQLLSLRWRLWMGMSTAYLSRSKNWLLRRRH